MPFDAMSAPPEAPRVAHRELRRWLMHIYTVLHELPPEQWGRRLFLESLRIEHALDNKLMAPEYAGLNEYIRQYASALREEIRVAARGPQAASTEEVLQAVDRAIHHIAESVAVMDGDRVRNDEYPHHVSLEDVCRLPGVRHIYDETRGLWGLQVRHGGKEAFLPLPTSSTILHKGGTPRVLLKLWMNADPSLIAAELPPNDIDVIVAGPRETWQDEALRLGADLEGIEQVADIDELQELFMGRDVDLNQCFLGASGLVFSERAARAAQSGAIEVSARNRVLYGSEAMRVEGRYLLKARGLMRVMKFVAEGKATSFEVSALNTKVDLGVYWLLLARKFMKKANGPELLLRLQELTERMRLERAQGSIIDVLDRVHEQFPFFEFADTALSPTDVARWLAKKAMKEVDKHFRIHGRVPQRPLFSDEELALEGMVQVSLEGFEADRAAMEELQVEWPAFLERCRRRNEQDRAQRQGEPPALFLEDDEV